MIQAQERLALFFVLAVLAGVTSGQQTCTVDRVSLSTLPVLAFSEGTTKYTFGFCSATQPTVSSLSPCSVPGYVQTHDASNNCVASYSEIVTGLTATTQGVYFVVRTASTNQTVNVSIACDRSSGTSQTTAALVTPTVGTTLQLRSYAACSVDTFFCSDSVACADSSHTCFNGVCFDTSCAQLSVATQSTKAPANFISKINIADCKGTPLVNASASNFSLFIDDVSTTDSTIANEVVELIESTNASPIPQLTTLVFDQSWSVQTNYQTILIDAAQAFVNIVTQSQNHYVALLGFDGGAEAKVLLQHTNDATAINTAIAALSQRNSLGDPNSTNLYGAVVSGLRESYQMKYSFGNISDEVISSMVFFTDGYDTAKRDTRANAIAEAVAFSSSVRIISVGISSASDSSFLSAISSGALALVSVNSLVDEFTRIGLQLSYLTSNGYYVMLCVPTRSTAVNVKVRLNETLYPSSNMLSFTFDASNFTGGCDYNALKAEVSSASSSRSRQVDVLTTTNPLTATVSARGAYFFSVAPTVSTRVSVSPTITVRYVEDNKCRISPYCSDGEFNTSMFLTPGVTYDMMVVSESTTPLSVVVTAVAAAPTPTVPGGVPVVVTPAPLNTNTSDVDDSDGDFDESAAVIFFVFGLIFFVIILILVCKAGCVRTVAGPTKEGHSGDLSRPLEPSMHSQQESMAPSIMIHSLSPPRKTLEVHSVFTEPNPYRSSAYFGDRSGLSSGDSLFTPQRSMTHEYL